jgi:hypothetical protein
MNDKINECLKCRHSFNWQHSDRLFCGAFFGNNGVSSLRVECRAVLKIHRDGCPKVEPRRPDQLQVSDVD